jgi:DNA-binding response OmpR family regulator
MMTAAGADGAAKTLDGLRVLVVEDETLVAMLVEDYLTELNCVVAGSARRIAKALEMVESKPIDVAVLDLNVAGDDISPLVEALEAKRIPYVFASGYGSKGLNPAWSHAVVLQKPFDMKQLGAAIATATRR